MMKSFVSVVFCFLSLVVVDVAAQTDAVDHTKACYWLKTQCPAGSCDGCTSSSKVTVKKNECVHDHGTETPFVVGAELNRITSKMDCPAVGTNYTMETYAVDLNKVDWTVSPWAASASNRNDGNCELSSVKTTMDIPSMPSSMNMAPSSIIVAAQPVNICVHLTCGACPAVAPQNSGAIAKASGFIASFVPIMLWLLY